MMIVTTQRAILQTKRVQKAIKAKTNQKLTLRAATNFANLPKPTFSRRLRMIKTSTLYDWQAFLDDKEKIIDMMILVFVKEDFREYNQTLIML